MVENKSVPVLKRRWIWVGVLFIVAIGATYLLLKKPKVQDRVAYGEYVIPRADISDQHFQPVRVDRIDNNFRDTTVSIVSQALGNKRLFVKVRSIAPAALLSLNERMAERLRASAKEPAPVKGTALYRSADGEDEARSLLFAAARQPDDLHTVWYRGSCTRINEKFTQCSVFGVADDLQYEVMLDVSQLDKFAAVEAEVLALLKSWQTADDAAAVLQFKG